MRHLGHASSKTRHADSSTLIIKKKLLKNKALHKVFHPAISESPQFINNLESFFKQMKYRIEKKVLSQQLLTNLLNIDAIITKHKSDNKE